VSLDVALLEILACPDTHHAPLDYHPAEQTLTCTECGRIFEIRDGIPVLLLSEARGGPQPAVASGPDPDGPTAADRPDPAAGS
jgi:uncharacterized protein